MVLLIQIFILWVESECPTQDLVHSCQLNREITQLKFTSCPHSSWAHHCFLHVVLPSLMSMFPFIAHVLGSPLACMSNFVFL